MKAFYAIGAFGVSALGVVGALGWIMAIILAIVLPGGSLILVGANYLSKKRQKQVVQKSGVKNTPHHVAA